MPWWLACLLVFAIISPELLDVDHWVHAASLVHAPNCSDPLVLCVGAHGLAEGSKRSVFPHYLAVFEGEKNIHLHSFEEVDVVHPNLEKKTR